MNNMFTGQDLEGNINLGEEGTQQPNIQPAASGKAPASGFVIT